MLDYVLAIFLIASPFILGFSDDGTAAAFFIVIGVVHLLLTIATRFVVEERPQADRRQVAVFDAIAARGEAAAAVSDGAGCRPCSTPRRRSRGRWRARA